MPEHEVELLYAAVRSVCAAGTAVLYVTHRLNEVFELADTVTVLRDGVRIETTAVANVDSDQLITLIAGRPLTELYPPPPARATEVALEARDICGTELAGVSLRIHEGEMLGLAGISGSGRDELNQVLFGSVPRRGGSVAIAGRSYAALSPRTAIDAGVAYLPADRRNLGAIPTDSVRENVTLPKIGHGASPGLARARKVDAWRAGYTSLALRPPSRNARSRRCPAATSRRPYSLAGCAAARGSCYSTNLRRGST